MPTRRGVRVTLLAEDAACRTFGKRALLEMGFARDEIRELPFPNRGSGKKHVTDAYPKQIKAFRREANHQRLALLVVTDVDELSVKRRFEQLEEAIAQHVLSKRAASEAICLWLPKWHVETWIAFLARIDVTEDEDAKHKARAQEIKPLAGEFVARYRRWVRDEDVAVLPSMEAAFVETQRLPAP